MSSSSSKSSSTPSILNAIPLQTIPPSLLLTDGRKEVEVISSDSSPEQIGVYSPTLADLAVNQDKTEEEEGPLPSARTLPPSLLPSPERCSSLINSSVFKKFKRLFGIPGDYEVLPCPAGTFENPPEGFSTFFVHQLLSGLRFPLHSALLEYSNLIGLPLGRFTPNSFKMLVGALALLASARIPCTGALLNSLFLFRVVGADSPFYYLATRPGVVFKLSLSSSIKKWKDAAFFLSCPGGWECPTEWAKGKMSAPDSSPTCWTAPYDRAVALLGSDDFDGAVLTRPEVLYAFGLSPLELPLQGDLDQYFQMSSLQEALQRAVARASGLSSSSPPSDACPLPPPPPKRAAPESTPAPSKRSKVEGSSAGGSSAQRRPSPAATSSKLSALDKGKGLAGKSELASARKPHTRQDAKVFVPDWELKEDQCLMLGGCLASSRDFMICGTTPADKQKMKEQPYETKTDMLAHAGVLVHAWIGEAIQDRERFAASRQKSAKAVADLKEAKVILESTKMAHKQELDELANQLVQVADKARSAQKTAVEAAKKRALKDHFRSAAWAEELSGLKAKHIAEFRQSQGYLDFVSATLMDGYLHGVKYAEAELKASGQEVTFDLPKGAEPLFSHTGVPAGLEITPSSGENEQTITPEDEPMGSADVEAREGRTEEVPEVEAVLAAEIPEMQDQTDSLPEKEVVMTEVGADEGEASPKLD